MNNNPLRFTDPTGHRECDYKCQIEYEGANPKYEHYGEGTDWDVAKQRKNQKTAETILYGGTEVIASVAFEPADWAFTAYHCANGDCSPLMLAGLLPIVPATLGSHGDEIAEIIGKGAGYIDPQLVRFSQSSISKFFRNGDSIDDLAEGLRTGIISPDSVPPIRLAQNSDGLIFSLDNRRLEAFRRAGVNIPFVLAKASDVAKEAWKFTTTTIGEYIQIRP